MEQVIVGKIVNTHGIKGELKVKTSTDFIEERFAKGAHLYIDENGVKMCIRDRFRAGAIDQLAVWADRLGIECIKGKEGGDPSSVVFDALNQAKEKNVDVLICDTAGRLQNKVNLMNELEKMNRIIKRVVPAGPQETLFVSYTHLWW